MRKHSKKLIAVVAGTAAAVSLSGVAYAYWTTTGAGSGGATAGTTAAGDAIQLTQTAAITGLYPGGSPVDISVKAHNPAAFHQVVGEVTVTPTYAAACPAANWTLVNADDAFGDLAANGDNTLVVGTIKLNETGANQDSCKNSAPTFALSSAPGE